ncbi:uncharacterized protein [Triticum aestivum]|uniref:uncharacterized protein n=1 Tax=Triticum aestivum TaxID=4565 RepID=UPI001D0237AA|nr:uncharacterized protein LOC123068121 [Triticum aestivum]
MTDASSSSELLSRERAAVLVSRPTQKSDEHTRAMAPRFIHSFIPLLRWLPHIAAAATHRLVSHVAAGHGLRPLPLPLPHRRRTHPPLITSPLLSSQEKRREEVRSGGGGGGGGPDPPRSPRASTASARRDMASDDAAVNPRYSMGMLLPCALLRVCSARVRSVLVLPAPPVWSGGLGGPWLLRTVDFTT